MSPFSRRVRLALAHKNLACDQLDARSNDALLVQARESSTQMTIPVLVDQGRAIGDSLAIINYLDVAYPDRPKLWPSNPDDAALAFDAVAAIDGALDILVDLGSRYFTLSSHDHWSAVSSELVGRAQRNLDRVGKVIDSLARTTVASSGWCAADITLMTSVLWLEGLPARVGTYAPVDRIVKLGWRLPDVLSHWADAHRGRADVMAL